MACPYQADSIYIEVWEIDEFKLGIFELDWVKGRWGVNAIDSVSEVGDKFPERNVLHVPL